MEGRLFLKYLHFLLYFDRPTCLRGSFTEQSGIQMAAIIHKLNAVIGGKGKRSLLKG